MEEVREIQLENGILVEDPTKKPDNNPDDTLSASEAVSTTQGSAPNKATPKSKLKQRGYHGQFGG
jgi:hypothetical protein